MYLRFFSIIWALLLFLLDSSLIETLHGVAACSGNLWSKQVVHPLPTEKAWKWKPGSGTSVYSRSTKKITKKDKEQHNNMFSIYLKVRERRHTSKVLCQFSKDSLLLKYWWYYSYGIEHTIPSLYYITIIYIILFYIACFIQFPQVTYSKWSNKQNSAVGKFGDTQLWQIHWTRRGVFLL